MKYKYLKIKQYIVLVSCSHTKVVKVARKITGGLDCWDEQSITRSSVHICGPESHILIIERFAGFDHGNHGGMKVVMHELFMPLFIVSEGYPM